MKPKTEKALTAFICGVGICGVVYGISGENDPVFLAGLFFVIGGYLLIRRRLKKS